MLRVAAYVAGGVAVLLAMDFVAASDFLTHYARRSGRQFSDSRCSNS